jgi:23S rRNA (cytosine1962-C5)-methyltransferase
MTKYFNSQQHITLTLTRDLSKHIKRGNPWIFKDALAFKEQVDSGAVATLISHKKEVLAHGYFCPKINLALRILSIGKNKITDSLIEQRILNAINKRLYLITPNNQCVRLINGEGDELPGLVCDLYHDVAVIKLDGEASENFWNEKTIAEFILKQTQLGLKTIFYKHKTRSHTKGEIIAGIEQDLTQHQFLEHNVKFQSNLIDAAKTGFFIDQRENRNLVRKIAQGKTLLNLFGYTGGFSVYAGLGGATDVTTVDIAPEAIEASKLNWKLNQLDPNHHRAILADCFAFIEEAKTKKHTWDIVIADPPSFAPNQKAIESAKSAYTKVFSDAIKLTKDHGIFIASSCSGHISSEMFLEICQEALSQARARGRVLSIQGQPTDHPYPLALPELRYLKFVMIEVIKD